MNRLYDTYQQSPTHSEELQDQARLTASVKSQQLHRRQEYVALKAMESFDGEEDVEQLSFPANAIVFAKSGQEGNIWWYGCYNNKKGWFLPSHCCILPEELGLTCPLFENERSNSEFQPLSCMSAIKIPFEQQELNVKQENKKAMKTSDKKSSKSNTDSTGRRFGLRTKVNRDDQGISRKKNSRSIAKKIRNSFLRKPRVEKSTLEESSKVATPPRGKQHKGSNDENLPVKAPSSFPDNQSSPIQYVAVTPRPYNRRKISDVSEPSRDMTTRDPNIDYSLYGEIVHEMEDGMENDKDSFDLPTSSIERRYSDYRRNKIPNDSDDDDAMNDHIGHASSPLFAPFVEGALMTEEVHSPLEYSFDGLHLNDQ